MTGRDPNRKTAFTFSDFLAWILLALIPILTAVYAISRVSLAWTAAYLIVLGACFAGIIYRFFCTHCPHYKNAGRTTKCIFLWGVPGYFEARPGPLRFFDKFMIFAGFAVAVGFPLYWLLADPLLLVIYAMAWAVLAAFLNKYECVRCINDNCPFNRAADAAS